MKKSLVSIASVGGGLAGSLSAIALSKLLGPFIDIELHIFEQFPNPFLKSQGSSTKNYLSQYDARNIVLSSATIEFFKQLGIWDDIAELLVPIHSLNISRQNGFATSQINAHEEGVEALGYVADLSVLSMAFQTLAKDVIFHYSVKMQQIKPKKNGYQLIWHDQESESQQALQVDLLIGADGQNSWVGQALNVELTYKSYEQTALVCNLDVSIPVQQEAYERFLSDGAITLLPLNHPHFDQRMSLVWIGPNSKIQSLLELSDAHFLDDLTIQMSGIRGGRLGFKGVGRRQVYPLGFYQRKERIRPHCVFIGNASQALHPIAAQGFNLAVRDIRDLCSALAQSLSQSNTQCLSEFPAPGVLQDFSEVRSKDVLRVKLFVDTLVATFFTPQKSIAGRALSSLQELSLLMFELFPGTKPGLSRFAMGGRSNESV